MDSLVANFAVTCVPDPMPVVMKAVACEWFHGRGTSPEIVVDTRRDLLWSGPSNRLTPLVAKRAPKIDIADCPILDLLYRIDHAGIRAGLTTMLANPVVFLHCTHQLTAFKRVVRAGFLDINVL